MIGVTEALAVVLQNARRLSPQGAPLAQALGLVLAEDIASDVDSPPHDKSVVDGYAVQAATTRDGSELAILEEVTAGEIPSQEVTAETATRIMTGAPIPQGADAVVMVELTEVTSRGERSIVRIKQSPKHGQNIMRRAASMHRGQTVLQAGREMTGIEVGLLAEVGRPSILTYPRPSVAVLTTGNELVEITAKPAAGQIRNSNGPMLAALVRSAGGIANPLGLVRDDEADLRAAIDRGLQHDLLVLSGGVSEGVLDLVPRVLAEAGVECLFHKVQLKPGKPLWFGVRRSGGHTPLVFGLPGNPVSSLVCFQLFVLPAIQAISARDPAGLPKQQARLAVEHNQRGDRPTYWPAAWSLEAGEAKVRPLAWQGSGDLRTLADADGLAFFPGGNRTYSIDDEVAFYYWRPMAHVAG